MQSASIWLVLPLFAIAWICFRTAWKLTTDKPTDKPELFTHIGADAVRKAARKARRLL